LTSIRIALISSGLGHTIRGIEIWMKELAKWLPSNVDVELWPGSRRDSVGPRPVRGLRNISRDNTLIGRWSWARRYTIEQWSALPLALTWTRVSRRNILYCGDPVLAWHLKRLRPVHGARVVFMNGMRLSARWAAGFDGVHLLAPGYLDAARNELGSRADNFFAVPHFADVEMFRPAAPGEKADARVALSLPSEAFVILTIGPVGSVSQKRLEWLAGEVSTLSKDVFLLSAGGDEPGADAVKENVRSLLGQRIRFLGVVSREKIQNVFRAADVYSLGSLGEPFSIAILEALACGLPVVHHHDPVMSWQAADGGVPVDMTARGSAAWAFQRLALDRTHRETTALAARNLAMRRYAPNVVCGQLVDSLEQVIKRASLSHYSAN
jgi:glycosyltransferase involved in cell wall biosynthesis